jgi:hypothetical protein
MFFASFMLPICGEGAAQQAPPSLRGRCYSPFVLSTTRWLRFAFHPLASPSHGLLLKRSWGLAPGTRHARQGLGQGSRQGLARLARGSRQGLARLARWHTPGAGRGGLSWLAAAERDQNGKQNQGLPMAKSLQKFKHEESQTQELQETTFSCQGCRNDNCRRARHGVCPQSTRADCLFLVNVHGSLGKREAVSFPEDVGIKTPKAVFHESPPARASRQLSHTKRATAVPNFIR